MAPSKQSHSSSVGLANLAMLTRQMSIMLNSGVPLVQILDFARQNDDSGLRQAFGAVYHHVSSGSRLSLALRAHPMVFSDVYCGLVEAGESSGQLSDSLLRLADMLERRLQMRQRWVAAMTYPAVLFSFTWLCLFGFVTFVMPRLSPVFLDMGVEVPWMTRLLMEAHRFTFPLAFFGVGFLMFYGWGSRWWRPWLLARPGLYRWLQNLPLRLPVLGPLLRQMAVAQFLFALAAMLESGTTLTSALGRAAGAYGHPWIIERNQICMDAIKAGLSCREAFQASQMFPRVVIQLVAVGEDAASLSDMLARAATICERDCETALEQFSQLLEPILMVGMGLVVGFMVVAGMLPTLQLMNNLG